MRTVKATKVLCFLGFCSVLTPELQGQNKGLSITKQWNQLDWAYSSSAEREQAIASGEFVRGNGLPIDTDVYYGPNSEMKVFMTVPRFVDGIPGTLNTVSQDSSYSNPLLQPFPSWDWHRNSQQCNQNRLISVFRVQIDECGRLWVLDTGKIGPEQLCNPQIIAFDPSTGQVLHRYEIPKDQISEKSILVTPVVDVRDPQSGCQNTFVYNADVQGFSIIVYDVRNRVSWKIENKLFYPIPDYGTFTIAGESFDLMDGVLGMALSPLHPGTDRVLYFHSLASNTENYVYTSVIRNRTIFQDHPDNAPRAFDVYRRKRASQAAAEAMDRNGVLYFGDMSNVELKCWNSQTEFDQKNFDTLDGNKQNLQFLSGVKMVNNRFGGQELWVLSCRIQKSYTGSMSASEVNFRILAAKTDNLLRGSKCKPRAATSGSGYGFNRPSRPQSTWPGVFSDTKATTALGGLANRGPGGPSSSAASSASSTSDELIFN